MSALCGPELHQMVPNFVSHISDFNILGGLYTIMSFEEHSAEGISCCVFHMADTFFRLHFNMRAFTFIWSESFKNFGPLKLCCCPNNYGPHCPCARHAHRQCDVCSLFCVCWLCLVVFI